MAIDNLQTIVVAIDFTRDSLEAVRTAFVIGHHAESRLHLLHVVHEVTTESSPPQKKKEIKKVLRPVLEVAADSMRAFVKEHDLAKLAKQAKVGLETVVAHGLPASQIVQTAKKLKADLIIVGYSGTTGIDNLLLGATTEKILQLADMPIMVVKAR
ncbi:universal stress protein [Candidatus Magnetaquicoccus inordinatus]|uniref:universal stress protein n=1 Tax=Candidatus Magnetaquicoccus inordinatus TaxID=2496818 RepID=UPI00187D17D6|nr:universal stress protein [Candidatus Magnetaquicoccus inordinatus]